MRRPYSLFIICVSVWLLMACQNQKAESMEMDPMSPGIEILYKAANCGGGFDAGAQWLVNSDAFTGIYKQIHSHMIMQQSLQTPEVDFNSYGVLFVSMGQQRSAGYALTWDKNTVEIKDNTLELELGWITPKPGMMTAQMLTNPCILLKIPKGNYASIIVKDQHGQIKAQVQTR